jgi:LysR family transcriptional regulator, carnitine catabolism transcriptional activator
MDVLRLTRFLGVVDHGSFTAAAGAGAVSQPALSQAVRELERELGVRLFERIGRRIRLTPAGRALVGPARQVLRDVETGRAAVAAVAGVESGSLTVAGLPTLTADPLAELVGHYRHRYPGVTVDLAAPEDSSDLLAMVRDGRCEAGITEDAEVPADLTHVALGEQDLLLLFPPGTGRSASRRGSGAEPAPVRDGSLRPAGPTGPPVDLTDLVDVAFVAAPVGTSSRRLLDEGFAVTGSAPRVEVVTAQRDAIVPLVLAGAGAALVPEPLAVMAAALGVDVARPRPSVRRRLILVHRSGPLAPAAERFVDLATRSARYGVRDGDLQPASRGDR